MTVPGIDVSHHNSDEPKKPIDWRAVSGEGIAFAFMKATEGDKYVDVSYPYNHDEAGRVGILRGAYHYFQPEVDPLEQARLHLEVVKDQPCELPCVLDFEKRTGLSAKEIAERAYAWLMVVADGTGRRPLIYTSPGYWNGVFGNDPPEWTNLFDLWVAHWEVEEPILPKGFTKWLFHQHSDKGRIAGIVGDVDLNKWHGTLEELRAYAEVVVPEPPSEPEEQIVNVHITATAPEGTRVVYVIGEKPPLEEVEGA